MLQDKLMRIMNKTSRFKTIILQYYKLKILKLEDLYCYEIAKLTSQYVYRMLRAILTIISHM